MMKNLHVVILGLAVSMPAMGQTVFSCGFEEGETGYELKTMPAVNDVTSIVTEIDRLSADTIDLHYTVDPVGDGEFYFDVDGGDRYLQWQCAGKFGSGQNKPDASYLTLKGFKLKDNTTYHVTYYVSSDHPGALVQCGVYHGTEDNFVPVAMDWENGSEIEQIFSNTGVYWKRVSYAFHYRSDAVYKEINGEALDSDYIRISFLDAGNRYCIDEVSIEEGTAASFFGSFGVYIIDFGYETNMTDFVDQAKFYDILQDIPDELFNCFSLTGISKSTGKRESIKIEYLYGGDGREPVYQSYLLYNRNPMASIQMELTQEIELNYDDCILTFHNSDSLPVKLQYTDPAYPLADKTVPDFECHLKAMSLEAPIPWNPTGVKVPVATSSSDVRHLDMLGRSVTPDAPGLHIVLRSDGSAKKVLVR